MEPIIKVDNVSMCFNLSTEKHESLKEYLLAMVQAAEISPEGGKIAVSTRAPSVRLHHVSFHYRPGEPVLHDCCLSVAAGEAVEAVFDVITAALAKGDDVKTLVKWVLAL